MELQESILPSMTSNRFFTVHNELLQIMTNMETEFSMDNILHMCYKINNVNTEIQYIVKNDIVEVRAKNEYGLHLIRKYVRLIEDQILYNTFIELTYKQYLNFLEYITQIYYSSDFLDLCCVCNTNLNIIDNKIKCCDTIECKKIYNCLPTNNIITINFNDREVFDFIFEAFSSSLKHPRFTELCKNDFMLIMEGVSNIDEMIQIIPQNIKDNNKTELYKHIEDSKNDVELLEKIGNNVYAIFKNIFSDNYFAMHKIDFDNNTLKPINVTILNISYAGLTENNFERGNNVLFHGSSIYSWYSITKKGLKNLSNTPLMQCGAAYGSGIYLSDSLAFSNSYSRSLPGYKTVIGVFLLDGDPNTYKKVNNIYVVEDCSKLILKSLIIHSSNLTSSEITSIQGFVKMTDESSITKKMVGKVKDKRLNKELDLLKAMNCVGNVNVIDDKNWNVDIMINGNVVNTTFIFNSYPFVAPSVVINSDNANNIRTRFIGNNKVIDLDILHPTQWKATHRLTDIVENIIRNIQN